MTDDELERRRLEAVLRVAPRPHLTDEQMNANLRAAVKGHTPHADRHQQPDLVSPLTEAELKTGGGYLPAITSVDMTPRPRYRETRQAFEARMASYGADVKALHDEVRLRNRKAALRSVELATGAIAYWTQCSCSWCGLRVDDPELARREYDAHVCAAAGVGQAAVDRAIAETDRNVLVKRPRAVLQPALGNVVQRADLQWTDGVHEVEVVDDFEQRVKLLEHK